MKPAREQGIFLAHAQEEGSLAFWGAARLPNKLSPSPLPSRERAGGCPGSACDAGEVNTFTSMADVI